MIRKTRAMDFIFSGCCSKVSLKLNSPKLYEVEGTGSKPLQKVSIVPISQLELLQRIAHNDHQLR
jgi:hypothetical protein